LPAKKLSRDYVIDPKDLALVKNRKPGRAERKKAMNNGDHMQIGGNARFIAERAGQSPETAERFLRAHDRYLELNYIVDLGEEDLTAERAVHADLITHGPEDEMKNEDDNKLLTYIRRVTAFERAVVASMIAEETAYDVQTGIADPNAYSISRSWADAIADEESELNEKAETEAPIN